MLIFFTHIYKCLYLLSFLSVLQCCGWKNIFPSYMSLFLLYAPHSNLCPFFFFGLCNLIIFFFHFFGLLAQKDHLIGLICRLSFFNSIVSLQFEDINIFPFIVFDLFPLMDSILCSISSLISIISIYFFWGKGGFMT